MTIVTVDRDHWGLRGHLSHAEAEWNIRQYQDDPALTIGPVEHRWWRFVPSRENAESEFNGHFIDATPGTQGAFKVTVVEKKEAPQ